MEQILCQYSSNKSSVLQINTICFAKKNSTFKQTQSDLPIQNSIWEKMQRYGQIYVLCVTTVRLVCLFMRKLDLIFSHTYKQIFSHVQLSNFLFQKQQMMLSVNLRLSPETRNTSLPFQTNMSGEQVSFCLTISIINHLDVFTKRPYHSVSEIHSKCCKVVNMID